MTGLRTAALCGRSGPHAWQQRHLLHDNTIRCLPQKFDSHPPAAVRFWLYGLFPQLFLRYLCKARWVPFSCSTRVVTPPRRRGPGPELVIPIVLHGGSLLVPSELARNPLHLYMPQASIPPHYHAESSHSTERIDCSKSLYGSRRLDGQDPSK